MPIIIQVNTYDGGSTGSIARNIKNQVRQTNGESYFFYGRDSYHHETHLYERKIQTSELHTFWHVLVTRLCDKHGLGSRIATHRFVKQIKELKPDIIHLHNIHGYYLNYKILFEYLAKSGIPVVWTLHDCWSFTGHCAHFVDVNCMRWQTECTNCPLKSSYPKSYIDRSKRNFRLKKLLFNNLGEQLTIVPVSNWLQNYVEQSYLQQHQIRTIHNGVDISIFKPFEPVQNVHKKAKIILGAASVWNTAKGLNDFIKLREMLSEDVVIKLVGLTKEQVANMPLGIIGIERTSCVEDLVHLYAEADVFVNPTYADTFPTVNLEALACGTPVITYRTGGCPEAVTSETGIVVVQGNLKELKDAIMTVLSNGKQHYSQACRKRAEEHFDKNKCFQQYIDLYNEILANKNI